MARRTVIVGAGGFGREMADLARQDPALDPVGFVDARVPAGSTVAGLPVLGNDSHLDTLRAEGVETALLAVGDPAARRSLYERLVAAGWTIPTVIHPSAYVAASATLGAGCVVYPQAAILAETELGENVLVNVGATVSHETTVGPHTNLNPGSHLAGRVRVGSGCEIGIGAGVRQGIAIGDGTVVGGGAFVARDLPAGVVAVGVPAVPRGADR